MKVPIGKNNLWNIMKTSEIKFGNYFDTTIKVHFRMQSSWNIKDAFFVAIVSHRCSLIKFIHPAKK
jgi:hypothetical protein